MVAEIRTAVEDTLRAGHILAGHIQAEHMLAGHMRAVVEDKLGHTDEVVLEVEYILEEAERILARAEKHDVAHPGALTPNL